MRILICLVLFLIGIHAETAHGYRTPFNRLTKSGNPPLDDRQQIVWINTTYQAEDNGVDIAQLPQCKAWRKWWTLENQDIELSSDDVDLLVTRRQTAKINSKKSLRTYHLPETLLDLYKEVDINFEEICRNHSRILWINTTQLAKRYNLNTKRICTPYRRSLEPTLDTIEEIIEGNGTALDASFTHSEVTTTRKRRNVQERYSTREMVYTREPSVSFVSVYNKQDGIQETETVKLIDSGVKTTNRQAETGYMIALDEHENNPVVTIRTKQLADHLNLNVSDKVFARHEAVSLSLRAICNGDTPELITNYQLSPFLVEDDETLTFNIGIHFNASQVDIQKLAETLRNDTKLDDILHAFDEINFSQYQPLASSYILPILKQGQYDRRTPPTLFTGQIVDVRVGIDVQSISNFELTTMDYDMDVWLRMAWRDPRLAHGLDRPIMINEETFLKKLWRPDPFFANAKKASFHRVTYLNFYMLIFPQGEIFFETRLYLKPSCQLVLCKYPHDNQMCSLRISLFGFTNDVVQLRWFSRLHDAIRRNKIVQLPELYIVGYSKHQCNAPRKSGNFSCLEARFYMKRSLGYHITQTYTPTAMCVIFSWISVWLPEEFVDGRIFVSLTVFLTLSAESSSAKEILPNVSYTKAIDIWFGFTSVFVFATMLQALAVISLEHNSAKLRKEAEQNENRISQLELMKLISKSKQRHRLARLMDTYCRTLYPVVLALFLIYYRFVIIEGEETKCLR